MLKVLHFNALFLLIVYLIKLPIELPSVYFTTSSLFSYAHYENIYSKITINYFANTTFTYNCKQ